MLQKEDRAKKVSFEPHTLARFYERGIKQKLFPHCQKNFEIFNECVTALRDENKSVIIQDKRNDSDSTHICIFINDAGNPVAVPIAVNTHNIHIFTLKDVKEDWVNPNWYVDEYNKIAKIRGMPLIPKIVKI